MNERTYTPDNAELFTVQPTESSGAILDIDTTSLPTTLAEDAPLPITSKVTIERPIDSTIEGMSFGEQAAGRLHELLPQLSERDNLITDGHINDNGRERADELVERMNHATWFMGARPGEDDFSTFSRNVSETYAYIRDRQHAGDVRYDNVDLEMLRRVCTSARYSFNHYRYQEQPEIPQDELIDTNTYTFDGNETTSTEDEFVYTDPSISTSTSGDHVVVYDQAQADAYEEEVYEERVVAAIEEHTEVQPEPEPEPAPQAQRAKEYGRRLLDTSTRLLGVAALGIASVIGLRAKEHFGPAPELEAHHLAQQATVVQADDEVIERLGLQRDLHTAPSTERPLPEEDEQAIEEASMIIPVLEYQVGEKVTLDVADENGETTRATFTIDEELNLDNPDTLAQLGGVLVPSGPNNAKKLTWTGLDGKKVVVYTGHSDKGAFEKLRDESGEETFAGRKGKSYSDTRGEEDITVASTTTVPKELAAIQSLMANLEGGTHFLTCEDYERMYNQDGYRMSTANWRLIEVQPTPVSPHAEVENQDDTVSSARPASRGLRAQRGRSRAAIRAARAEARTAAQS